MKRFPKTIDVAVMHAEEKVLYRPAYSIERVLCFHLGLRLLVLFTSCGRAFAAQR